MKRILFMLFFLGFTFSSVYSEAQNNFLEVSNSVTVEKDLYDFLYNYFIERSSSLINYQQRFIVDKKNPKRGNSKFYSKYGYSWELFPDDRFYIVNKISINEVSTENEISEFFSKMGVICEEIISYEMFFSNCYEKNGEKTSGLVKISDKIVLEKYLDKYLVLYEYESINYNWALANDEEAMVEKLKNGELKIEKKEDPNHYTTEPKK